MSSGTLGHRDVGTKAPAQLDVLFETANCWKVLVVNGRQLFPSVALRNDIAGWIPDRQSTQKLTVVFADHGSYLPAFREAPAHLLRLRRPSSLRAVRRRRPPMKFYLLQSIEFPLPTSAKVTRPQLDDCRPTFSCGGLSWPCGPCARPAPCRSRTRRACGPA